MYLTVINAGLGALAKFRSERNVIAHQKRINIHPGLPAFSRAHIKRSYKWYLYLYNRLSHEYLKVLTQWITFELLPWRQFRFNKTHKHNEMKVQLISSFWGCWINKRVQAYLSSKNARLSPSSVTGEGRYLGAQVQSSLKVATQIGKMVKLMIHSLSLVRAWNTRIGMRDYSFTKHWLGCIEALCGDLVITQE